MAKFKLPIGEDFKFSVVIYQDDTFLIQPLTDDDGNSIVDEATFELINPQDNSVLFTVTADTISNGDEKLFFNIQASDTDNLTTSTGTLGSWYYTKPKYKGKIKVKFTDASKVTDKLVLIDKVYMV